MPRKMAPGQKKFQCGIEMCGILKVVDEVNQRRRMFPDVPFQERKFNDKRDKENRSKTYVSCISHMPNYTSYSRLNFLNVLFFSALIFASNPE